MTRANHRPQVLIGKPLVHRLLPGFCLILITRGKRASRLFENLRPCDQNGNLIEDKNAAVYETIGEDTAEWDALWAAVKQGMAGVVSAEDHGTAGGKFSQEFTEKYLDRIAGKTGSAQVGTTSIDIENTSWFVSYTPREGEAELVIVICVPSGYAGVWSVSAAEEIYTYYFNKQDSAAPETLVDIGGIAP